MAGISAVRVWVFLAVMAALIAALGYMEVDMPSCCQDKGGIVWVLTQR